MPIQNTPIKSTIHYTLLFCITLWALTLTGCASFGNVDSKYDPSAHPNTGLILFSVTHDKDNNSLFRKAGNIYLEIFFRNIDTGENTLRAVSNDWGSLIPTTPFDNAWGTLYVREFTAGHYELSSWGLHQDTGMAVNSFTPKQPPAPIAFEVRPNTITYIGNIHGSLLWGENMFGIDLVSGAIPQIKNEAQRDIKMILKDYPQFNDKISIAPLRTGSWQIKSQ